MQKISCYLKIIKIKNPLIIIRLITMVALTGEHTESWKSFYFFFQFCFLFIYWSRTCQAVAASHRFVTKAESISHPLSMDPNLKLPGVLRQFHFQLPVHFARFHGFQHVAVNCAFDSSVVATSPSAHSKRDPFARSPLETRGRLHRPSRNQTEHC